MLLGYKRSEIMIIDVHTHTFPDRIAKQTIKSMEDEIVRAQPGLENKAATEGTYEALKKSNIANGIDLSMVAPVATRPEQVQKINSLSGPANENYKENRVFYMGAIHPDCENYKQAIDEIVAMDLRAIKIHPDYQKVFFDDERYIRIMDYAANKGLGIITHAGEDIGLPEVIHCTPDMVLNVLKHIQPDKLILAHFGAWRGWDEVEEKLCGQPVYFDTAFVLKKDIPHIENDQFCRIVRKHGADRVLFGTDSPWYDQGQALRDFEATSLTDEEKKLVLGENANRLFKLL